MNIVPDRLFFDEAPSMSNFAPPCKAITPTADEA
jgi:hypothetical protein